MSSPNILYYGHSQLLPEQVPLRAGPISLIYEAGDLRYIQLGNNEILRRIYAAVRDHNWGTALPILSNEQIITTSDSFKITYDVTNQQNDIDFFWQGTVVGDSNGTITFTMTGIARSTFRRNRIGFCVLHPITCAGAPAKVEHIDGSIEECAFPTLIAPQLVKDGHPWPVAPFDNLRAISHQVLPHLWAKVQFDGDIFEMEDQRNWTDASYKIYCTPLSLPFPFEIKAGTKITQSIQLTFDGNFPETSTDAVSNAITFSVASDQGISMPNLGLGVASHGQPLSAEEIDRLSALHLSHLRVDLHLSKSGYKTKLRQAVNEANSLGTSLEIAIFLTDSADSELIDLYKNLQEIQPPVLRWLIFHENEKTTTAHWVNLARQHLANYNPTAKIGAGTNAYFTELNAKRPPVNSLDVVVYSINPQVHAFDNGSLTEALAAQAETIISARSFTGDKPIIISPVTLKPRFNPNAVGAESEPAEDELPAQVDVRQSSLYGLAWTLGSLKYLAESGTDSITFYETTGWRGVMEQAGGAPLPQKFSSIPASVYPLYHLFADVADMAGGRVIPIQSSQPLQVEGLLIERDKDRMLLFTNFTQQLQSVLLTDLPPMIKLRRINETNVMEAMESPEIFRQQPYETCITINKTTTLQIRPFETVRVNL